MAARINPNPGGAFGVTLNHGLLLGIVAGAAWVASRPYNGTQPRLINWDRVRRAALSLAAEDDPKELTLYPTKADLLQRYREWVAQSERLISDYVGEESGWVTGDGGREEAIRIFNGREWVLANLTSFEKLFEPLERVNQEMAKKGITFGSFLLGQANQTLVSSQLGAVLGYLSHRVLGQYDLALLGREPLPGDEREVGLLYFVEPNLAQLQERLGLDPNEFRLWIALHETTHAYEFEGHPWIRGYMNGLLERYFDSVSRDLLGFGQGADNMGDLIWRVGGNLFKTRYALELVMTVEQREIFSRMQALMALIEGYSNHVMDAVGRDILPSYEVMKERFEERASRKGVGDRLFSRLTGLDLKMEQYRAGERFVGEVVRLAGVGVMNRAWTSPESLPSLDEIYHPRSWVERMGN